MAAFDFQPKLTAIDKDEGDDTAVVPKELHSLYKKADDGSYTIMEGLAKKLDNTGLTSALDKERKNGRELSKTLKSYQDLGKVEELQERLAALKEAGGEGSKQWDKLKVQLQEAHAKELQERDKRLEGMKGSLNKHLIDAQATAAIAELKGSAKLLLPHIRSQVTVVDVDGEYKVQVLDSEGDPRSNAKGEYMTIKDLVEEMRKSSDFAAAFATEVKPGSGKQPGSSGSGGTPNNNLTPTQKIAMGLSQRNK